MKDKSIRAAFFLCGFAAFINLYATQGILRELAIAFDVSAERAGQGVSATTLAVAIIAPFVGTLAARFDRRNVIVAAALASALPVVWSAHAPGFASFLAARFAAGMLMPFIFAMSISYIGERYHRERATEVSAIFVAGTTLGGFAGRFVTNLLTSMLGWRHALDIVAVLAFATGLAIYASLPASGHVRTEGGCATKTQWKLVMRGPVLASFAVGACVLASQVATFTFVGLRLTRAPFNFSTAGIGAIYAVFLVAVVVTPISGRMARHRGAARPRARGGRPRRCGQPVDALRQRWRDSRRARARFDGGFRRAGMRQRVHFRCRRRGPDDGDRYLSLLLLLWRQPRLRVAHSSMASLGLGRVCGVRRGRSGAGRAVRIRVLGAGACRRSQRCARSARITVMTESNAIV